MSKFAKYFKNLLAVKTKEERLQLIVSIITEQCISNQRQLMDQLAKEGLEVTQATLSRDLKSLKVTKIANDNGGYVFIIPNINDLHDTLLKKRQRRMGSAPTNRVLSIAFSRNIAIIKTRNGHATALAYDIDMSNQPEILGTIPGADTVIAVLREDVTHEQAQELFSQLLPQHKGLGARV